MPYQTNKIINLIPKVIKTQKDNKCLIKNITTIKKAIQMQNTLHQQKQQAAVFYGYMYDTFRRSNKYFDEEINSDRCGAHDYNLELL